MIDVFELWYADSIKRLSFNENSTLKPFPITCWHQFKKKHTNKPVSFKSLYQKTDIPKNPYNIGYYYS